MPARNSPELIPPLGHYSHAFVHQGVAHISGQLPLDPDGNPLNRESFATQVDQVLENLDHCLAAAGTSREQLISVTVYLTGLDDWPAFNARYASWIGEHRPARAVVGVDRLHFDCAVEVQAVASVNN